MENRVNLPIFFGLLKMTEVVYSISHKKKLLYIGRTNNFHRRFLEHMRAIEGGCKKNARRYKKAFRNLLVRDLDFQMVYDGSAK